MHGREAECGKRYTTVIGANKRCDGYFEGNGYRVTWAVGHLVGLAEPDAYGFVSQEEMYGSKTETAYAELPLIPEEFKLIVLEPTKDQFEIVKKLIQTRKWTRLSTAAIWGQRDISCNGLSGKRQGVRKRYVVSVLRP